MLLVSLHPISHGPVEEQVELYHHMRCLSYNLLKGMNRAATSVLRGMASVTTPTTPAQLMYTVSGISLQGQITDFCDV